MQIEYQYEVQDELPLDHDDSLDHWAALLADQEVGERTYDADWQHHYENFWMFLDAGYNYDILRPQEDDMLPDEMEAEKNRKIILAQADEIEILKRNVKELQQSLQNAYADISRLTEDTNAN